MFTRLNARIVYLLIATIMIIIPMSFLEITYNHKQPDLWYKDRSSSSVRYRLEALKAVALKTENMPFSHEVDWMSLIPQGDGFIKLDGQYYLVSLYHQLHCINGFRQSLQEYRQGRWNASSNSRVHFEHCLDYIRQSVLCNADVTLEPSPLRRTSKGEIVHASTGYGVVHQCRDWTEVRKQVDSNYDTWKATDDFFLP